MFVRFVANEQEPARLAQTLGCRQRGSGVKRQFRAGYAQRTGAVGILQKAPRRREVTLHRERAGAQDRLAITKHSFKKVDESGHSSCASDMALKKSASPILASESHCRR